MIKSKAPPPLTITLNDRLDGPANILIRQHRSPST